MKKHILIVSQYFYPEQFRINDIALEWIKRGYEVTVLTGIPNYPQGKFYPGYGWFKRRRETWNGINIIRIPLFARGKRSIGMVLNYLSFVVSGFFWKCFTKVRADLVFTFEVSPMTQALIGVWYSKRRKVPHYLYVQDLWPENVQSVTGIKSRAIIGPIGKMVNYIYRYSDKIFATSPSFVEMIRQRVPDEQEKVAFWPQYAEDFYLPHPKRATQEISDDGSFRIVFTGNIGRAQGLEILPVAAKILMDEGHTDVSFVIVGEGRQKDSLLQQIRALGVEAMFGMIEKQPAERIPELLAACDVAFVSFSNDQLFEKTIPAKLQSYMACGMPIIAVAAGETERIVREAECGICCEMGNAESLATGIKQMKSADLSAYSLGARKYFLDNYSKKMLMDKMDMYVNNHCDIG